MIGPVSTDWLREVCMGFPGVTEQVQWGYDLVFKVGGKMFAVTPLEPAPVFLSFKASPEKFAELTERASIIPAPYLARAQWVSLENKEALPAGELAELLGEAYRLVAAKLPQKVQAGLGAAAPKESKTKAHAVSTLARTLAKTRRKKSKIKARKKTK